MSPFDGQRGAFPNLLMREGLDPVYGFRPMRFVIQKRVDNPLAEALPVGTFQPDDNTIVDVAKESLIFTPPQRVSQARAA